MIPERIPQYAVYDRMQRETAQISDAPTIEILDDVMRRTRKHVAWGDEVLDRLCDTEEKRLSRRSRVEEVRALLEECGGVTGEISDESVPAH